ncbi:unnamed protein product, partial [Rotaria sp. Silwood2]
SCLPANIELDGRSTLIRNFPTLLTDYANNTGSIRIDDTLLYLANVLTLGISRKGNEIFLVYCEI